MFLNLKGILNFYFFCVLFFSLDVEILHDPVVEYEELVIEYGDPVVIEDDEPLIESSPKRFKWDNLQTTPKAGSSCCPHQLTNVELSSSSVSVSTPKTKQINILKESLTKEKRRVRAVRAKLYRTQRKLESLKEMFDELKSKSYISDNANDTLQVNNNFKLQ